MTDDELQLKAQRSLQEYDDAVENLDPRFAEIGRNAVAVLDEFIAHWKRHPASPESRANPDQTPEATSEQTSSEMREFVEKLLNWAQSERHRVLAQLSKGSEAK
jgi:hypothetical protein